MGKGELMKKQAIFTSRCYEETGNSFPTKAESNDTRDTVDRFVLEVWRQWHEVDRRRFHCSVVANWAKLTLNLHKNKLHVTLI